MLGALENQLIYYPTPYPLGNWDPPGLDKEDVFFLAEDGVPLHGWYCECPPAVPSVTSERPRPVLVYFHGNAGNLSDRSGAIQLFQRALGVDVFILDYRGYGRSGGRPDEPGLYRDSRAGYLWLTKERGIDPDRLVLRGGSLGGAVALELGCAVPHRCLILESTFTSMVDVARELYPLLPVGLLMRSRFPSRERIRSYHRPVLIIHGTDDELVPIAHGRALYQAANEPKQLLEIEGAGHNDTLLVGGVRCMDQTLAFLRQVFG